MKLQSKLLALFRRRQLEADMANEMRLHLEQRTREQLAGRIDSRFSYPDYLDYCAETQAFSDIVAVSETKVYLPEEVPLEVGSPQESAAGIVSMQAVSGNYFSALGAEIVLGRNFLPGEAGPHSGQPVVVVSHLFWQTHLHGDTGVLGTTQLRADPRVLFGRQGLPEVAQ
jgi:hypothetical protein